MSDEQYIVGVDLGTSNSSVSVHRFGRPDVIANYLGERVTPSIVYFDPNSTLTSKSSDEDILVGKAASDKALRFPQNVLFGTKRMIGRRFKDPIIQSDLNSWPYRVIESPHHEDDKKPLVEIQHAANENDKNQTKISLFTPEQLGGFILKDLIKTASDYLGQKVTKAVITVPANFNSLQRAATIKAAQTAGVEVVKLLNEPTAAAFAYGFQSQLLGKGKQHILIYDFGGGTLDVTIMHCESGIFKVLGTQGDTHLGGQDFDNALLEFCFKAFKQQTAISATFGKDKKSASTLRKLRNDVERAKCDLSTSKETYVTMYYNNHEEVIDITRSDFEKAADPIFRRCLQPVEALLKRIKLDEAMIDEIILVGGSTRIPKVQSQLTQYFSKFKNGEKQLSKSINPDEAVCIGASLQAAILSNCKHQGIAGANVKDDIKIHDVIPLSLGLKTIQNTFDIIIKRNTILPIANTSIEVPLSSLFIEDGRYLVILEGEDENDKCLIETSKIDISHILSSTSNTNQMIKITFNIDINGTLNHLVSLSNQATLPPPPPPSQVIPLTFHTLMYYMSLTTAQNPPQNAANSSNEVLSFLKQITTKDEFHIMFDNHYNLSLNSRRYTQILSRVTNITYKYENQEKKTNLQEIILSLVDYTSHFDLIINVKDTKNLVTERSLPNVNDIIQLYLELTVDNKQSKIIYNLHTFQSIQICTQLTTTADNKYYTTMREHLDVCKEFYLTNYLKRDISLSEDIMAELVDDTPFDVIPIQIKQFTQCVKPLDEYNINKIFYNGSKDVTFRLINYIGTVIKTESGCPDHRDLSSCTRISVNSTGVVNNGITAKTDTLEIHFNDYNKLTQLIELGAVVSCVECIVPDKKFGQPLPGINKMSMATTLCNMSNRIEFNNLMSLHNQRALDYVARYCPVINSLPRPLPPSRQIIPTTLQTFDHYLLNSSLSRKSSSIADGLWSMMSSVNSQQSSIPNDHITYGKFDLTANAKNYTKIRVRVSGVDVVGTVTTFTVHDFSSHSMLTFKDRELGEDISLYPAVGDIVDLYYELCISSSDKPVAKYFHCYRVVRKEPVLRNRGSGPSINRSPSISAGHYQRGASSGPAHRGSVGPASAIQASSSNLGSNQFGSVGGYRGASLGPRGSISGNIQSSTSTGNFNTAPGLRATSPPAGPSAGVGTYISPSIPSFDKPWQLVLLEAFKLCEHFYNINNGYSLDGEVIAPVITPEIQITTTASSSALSTSPNNNSKSPQKLDKFDFINNDNPFTIIPITYDAFVNDISYDENNQKAMLFEGKDISYRLVQYISKVYDVDTPCPSCIKSSECTRVHLVDSIEGQNRPDHLKYMHYTLCVPHNNRITTPDMLPSDVLNIHLISPPNALKLQNDGKTSNHVLLPSLFASTLSLSKDITEDEAFFIKLNSIPYTNQFVEAEQKGEPTNRSAQKAQEVDTAKLADELSKNAASFKTECVAAAVDHKKNHKSWGWW